MQLHWRYKTTMPAIRSTVGNFAAWCRVASWNNNDFHDNCPYNPNQLVLVHNRSGKPEKGPSAAMKHVKAVFNDLSNDRFLMKCL